jgi:hypothetical protein
MAANVSCFASTSCRATRRAGGCFAKSRIGGYSPGWKWRGMFCRFVASWERPQVDPCISSGFSAFLPGPAGPIEESLSHDSRGCSTLLWLQVHRLRRRLPCRMLL